MTTQHSHQSVQELLAAYALNAVDGDEADAVERHLRDCPRCRAEVAEHREAASLLAIGHEPAPPGVWDRIVADLDPAPTAGPAPVLAIARHRRFAGLRVSVAAVAAAVIGLLGVVSAHQQHRLDDLHEALRDRSLLASALSVHSRPDARQVELRSGEGLVLAHAVMTPDGTGFLWADGLPPVGSDRTYQLWAVVAGETVSAGVLGPQPQLVPFQASGDVTALAITEEVAGGVTATQRQPLVAGLLQRS